MSEAEKVNENSLESPHKIRRVNEQASKLKTAWASAAAADESNGVQFDNSTVSGERHKASLDARSCEWEEVELVTSWGTLRGKRCGTGSRKILGVHGWLDNANTFDYLMPLLQPNYSMVSLDLPGHGKSDHFNSGFIYDPRGYVGALKKAVIALGWEKFTYLGHSMGAVVGILYCSIFPEDVDGFISIDIIKPWSSEASKYPQKYRQYFNSYLDNEHKSQLPPIVYSHEVLVQKTIEGSGFSLDVASAELLLERGAVPAPGGQGFLLTRDLRAKTYFIGFTSFEAWLAIAEAIICPILIIKAKSGKSYETAERYDAMLEAFKRHCPLYRYHEMEGKHHVHMVHASQVAAVLQPFLNDTSRSPGSGSSEDGPVEQRDPRGKLHTDGASSEGAVQVELGEMVGKEAAEEITKEIANGEKLNMVEYVDLESEPELIEKEDCEIGAIE